MGKILKVVFIWAIASAIPTAVVWGHGNHSAIPCDNAGQHAAEGGHEELEQCTVECRVNPSSGAEFYDFETRTFSPFYGSGVRLCPWAGEDGARNWGHGCSYRKKGSTWYFWPSIRRYTAENPTPMDYWCESAGSGTVPYPVTVDGDQRSDYRQCSLGRTCAPGGYCPDRSYLGLNDYGEEVCKCDPGYEPNPNKSACVSPFTCRIGESCDFSRGGSCPDNSSLVGSSCQCDDNYKVNSSKTACDYVAPEDTAVTIYLSAYSRGEESGVLTENPDGQVLVLKARAQESVSEAVAVQVVIGDSGDSAQRGSDYSISGGHSRTITIAKGATVGTVEVLIRVNEDYTSEGSESVSVWGCLKKYWDRGRESNCERNTVDYEYNVQGSYFAITDASALREIQLSTTSTVSEGSRSEVTITANLVGRDYADKTLTIPVSLGGGTATQGSFDVGNTEEYNCQENFSSLSTCFTPSSADYVLYALGPRSSFGHFLGDTSVYPDSEFHEVKITIQRGQGSGTARVNGLRFGLHVLSDRLNLKDSNEYLRITGSVENESGIRVLPTTLSILDQGFDNPTSSGDGVIVGSGRSCHLVTLGQGYAKAQVDLQGFPLSQGGGDVDLCAWTTNSSSSDRQQCFFASGSNTNGLLGRSTSADGNEGVIVWASQLCGSANKLGCPRDQHFYACVVSYPKPSIGYNWRMRSGSCLWGDTSQECNNRMPNW